MVHVAALYSPKAKLWVEGRKQIWHHISYSLNPNEKRIWIHCASLGEFEQGRPVLEFLKKHYPAQKIVLTFFSPSGYEKKKHEPLADYVFYLPNDTVRNARKFIALIQPHFAVFVKYEFWHNYIYEAAQKQIPMVYISVLLRPNHYLFKFYSVWFRNNLSKVSAFLVQDEKTKELLKNIGIEQVVVTGDTRFDRVLQIASATERIPEIETFKSGKKLWIAGSSWAKDESVIAPVFERLSKDYKLLIVPHEVGDLRIQEIEATFNRFKCLRFTAFNHSEAEEADVLIVNTIGLLSRLYRYADLAYIGGAFGKGLHNILEAAVFGVPVIFGPHIRKFPEAQGLINAGGGFSIANSQELTSVMERLNSNNAHQEAGACARKFIENHQGATLKVTDFIVSSCFERL